MKRKNIVILVLLALVALAGASVYFASKKPAVIDSQKTLYTCGMHTQIIKDKPGDCPICGMKLMPVRKQPSPPGPAASGKDGADRKVKYYKSTMMLGEISQTLRKDSMGMDMVPVYEGEDDSGAISIDPVTTQNMGLRTAVVTKGAVRRNIRTVGAIDFNETALSEVTTKFKGWIEKLYVDSTGRQVHKGEPLFEIYSPDLYSAQNEYVLASARGIGPKESALTKLKYYDVSDEQIAELESSKQAKKTLSVSAPRDGIVVEKMAVEGQMVEAGMKLYRIADLSTVWVQSQVYEQDLGFIKLGQEAVVSLSYLPDRKFRGRVTYIYPTVDEKTRTAKVRMEFHNPGFFLKPGMFATVQIEAQLEAEAVLVPDMAVLRSGEKNTVFIALDGGKFEPRTVTIGARSENNTYQVLSGLKEGERVVTSGQFMLDSESQLREAIQKMLKPQAAPGEHSEHQTQTPEPSGNSAQADDSTSFICPMPEHVSIRYQQPGKCPICGMTLVPVRNDMLAKLQPDGKLDHYTCPMPEHADVNVDKPGKCPRCGMTLIPVMIAPAPANGAEPAVPSPAPEHKH
jgi:Cu(I)/Ag(I) efflux system membrane fusion protein